jgi:hypothetical protein
MTSIRDVGLATVDQETPFLFGFAAVFLRSQLLPSSDLLSATTVITHGPQARKRLTCARAFNVSAVEEVHRRPSFQYPGRVLTNLGVTT